MSRSLTTFIQILAGNIVLRHLMRANFPLVSVIGVFDALHHVGLERVPFFEQLVDTLRIRTLDIGQSLQIPRLLARPRAQSFQSECLRIHALAFPPNLFLKCAGRFPDGYLVTVGLCFHLRLSRSCLLLRQLFLGAYPALGHLLLILNRLPHRRHLLARSPHAVVARGVFLFSSLSLTRHFLKSASPRKKADDTGRFRFRARAQTAASHAIFGTFFAFPVEAAHRLAGWPVPWWNAAGSNVRLGNCSASRSSCQRREPAHAAELRLPVPGVSRILRVRSGWPGVVRWDLPAEDRRSRCQDPDSPGDSPKDRRMGKNYKGKARNTTGCSRSHTDIPIPNTATRSQIPSPTRNRILGPNIFRPSRNRRSSHRHDIRRRRNVRRRNQSGLRRGNLHPRETLLRRLHEILHHHRRRGILLRHRDLHVGRAPAAATNSAQSSRRGQKLEIRCLYSYHYPQFHVPSILR